MADEQLEGVGRLLRAIKPGTENVFEVIEGIEGADGSKTLRIVQERKPLLRKESRPRDHVFFEASGFAAYLKAFGIEGKTVVYVNASGDRICAVLDELAEKGREILFLHPRLHPLMAPWDDQLGERNPLELFCDFLMENRRSISEPAGMEIIDLFNQVTSSSKTTLQRGRGQNSTTGITVTTEIHAGKPETSLVELPDMIKVNVPVFVGCDPQIIEIDLTLYVSDGQIFVRMTSAHLTTIKAAAIDRMAKEIGDVVGNKFLICDGTPREGEWGYWPQE